MKIHSIFLIYFDEVCRTGSIRKAAKNLFVASSAVNRQILKKEQELGVKLFTRTHKGIELTKAGEILSQHVSRTLSDYERTMREISATKTADAQGITLVGQESVVSRFLPPIFSELQSQFPGLATTFIAASGRDLNDYLINGRADVALAFDPVVDANIEQVDAIDLPVGAVVSPSHPLSKLQAVNLIDCIEYPLILPDESWPLQDILNKELSNISANNHDVITTTSNSMEFLRSMLGKESRVGFQTIIGLEDSISSGDLVHIPLVSKEHHFTQKFAICINRNKEASRDTRAILRLIKKGLDLYKE